MPDSPDVAPQIALSPFNFGAYPMVSHETRLQRRFSGNADEIGAAQAAVRNRIDADAALAPHPAALASALLRPLQSLPKAFIHFNLAFSRTPGQPKRYMQDVIHERAVARVPLIADPNTHFYICGLEAMEEGVSLARREVTVAAKLDWDASAAALKREGRLHLGRTDARPMSRSRLSISGSWVLPVPVRE